MGFGKKSKSYDERKREVVNLISKNAYSVGDKLNVNINIGNEDEDVEAKIQVADKTVTKVTQVHKVVISLTKSEDEGFE